MHTILIDFLINKFKPTLIYSIYLLNIIYYNLESFKFITIVYIKYI